MHFMDSLTEISRPKVEQKEWMKGVDLRLATVEDLDTIAQECIDAGTYGLDLETTGLDQRAFAGGSGRKETMDKVSEWAVDAIAPAPAAPAAPVAEEDMPF